MGREGLERATAGEAGFDPSRHEHAYHERARNARRTRADAALKHIPVIMLTARCESQDIAAASAHGVSDYVTKPFDFAQLMAKIQTILKSPGGH